MSEVSDLKERIRKRTKKLEKIIDGLLVDTDAEVNHIATLNETIVRNEAMLYNIIHNECVMVGKEKK